MADLLRKSLRSLWSSLRHHPPAAWVTLVISLVLTWAGWYVTNQFIQHRASDRYAFQVKDVLGAIQQRMQTYESMLRGGAGLFGASETVDRREWKTYVQALQLDQRFPGIMGFGYIERISTDQLSAHLSRIRTTGNPDYVIRPEGPRDVYSATTYLEPDTEANHQALGLDLYAQPNLRGAMDRARDTGMPALSRLVSLDHVGSPDLLKERRLFMFLPIYRKNAPLQTPTERQNALEGWIYTSMHSQDLLRDILGASNAEIDVEVFDGTDMRRDTMLYHDLGEEEPHLGRTDYAPDFSQTTRLEFGGETWSLFIHTQPGYIAASDTGQPIIVALGGLALDVLLFLMIGIMSDRHQQAHRIASAMTEGLQQSETRLRAILDNFPFMVWLKDEEGRLLAVNDPYAHACGRPDISSVVGMSEADLWPQDIAQAHEEQAQLAMQDRLEHITIGRITRAGQERWMEVHCAPWCANNGTVLGTVGYTLDISEQKQAEQSLRASERRFRQIFEQAAVGTVLIAPDAGEILDANIRFAEFCGHSRSQLLGMPLQDLLELGPDDSVTAWIGRLWQPGENNHTHEVTLRHHDGHTVWAVVGMVALRDDHLPLPLMVMSVIDITAHKRAEQALHDSKELLDLALLGSTDGLWRYEIRSNTLVLSPRYKALLGYSEHELDGLDAQAFIEQAHPEDRPRLQAIWTACHQGETAHHETTLRLVHKDGHEMPVLLRLFVGRDDQNHPQRLVGTCIDLSERLRLLCNWPAAAQASPTVPRPMLWVVEPDASLRETLGQMLSREGYAVRAFDQALPALAAIDHDTGPKPQHLLVAQQLTSELSGLELAIAMRSRQPDLRIVLTLEAHAPAIHTELAHNQGVQQILHKPFDATTWLHALTVQGI
ncbi:MAG: PAS domain S-box protein [Leptothrix ochracea]|uniref:PAS domain S-box protein n=1 Tax=Leptothrix ochracea TaxID=735331 RepID=UPI0034E1CC70